ncbi:MAG: P-II family nitrogen regulator [Lachnospiraceae bacterium]|jgi:nitrogen regulatory protein P-II 1|nr:P-II family nitrogen regulator [Lachnospiraceae bacterium]MBQ9340764.1 P-II family nitrogen regulator [Lachnospiraceae bacterium]MBQ9580436.1 P-II family nitrogen regulator [Lachnospiraceae bacterium]MBR0434792.1 P-II family nitrogen regulator [Lachnospiraceae bacterium]MCR5345451.1 P-II family nitrogen regulator [Lachnospiraceae bacterium]
MKKIEVITRTENLETVKKVLAKNDYSGMTVTTVMGCGNQKSDSSEFSELNVEINLLPRIHVMTVVWDEDLDDVVYELQQELSSGSVGDGKIFVSTVDEGIRIRTGERGDKIL